MGDVFQLIQGKKDESAVGKKVTLLTAFGAVSGVVVSIDTSVKLSDAVIRPVGNIRDSLSMTEVIVNVSHIIGYAPYIESSFYD